MGLPAARKTDASPLSMAIFPLPFVGYRNQHAKFNKTCFDGMGLLLFFQYRFVISDV